MWLQAEVRLDMPCLSDPYRDVPLCVQWRGLVVTVDSESEASCGSKLRFPRGGLLHLAARVTEGDAHQRRRGDPALPDLHVGGWGALQVEVPLPQGDGGQSKLTWSPGLGVERQGPRPRCSGPAAVCCTRHWAPGLGADTPETREK